MNVRECRHSRTFNNTKHHANCNCPMSTSCQCLQVSSKHMCILANTNAQHRRLTVAPTNVSHLRNLTCIIFWNAALDRTAYLTEARQPRLTHQTNQFGAYSFLLHSKQFTVTACRPDSKTKSLHSPVFSGVLPHALSVLWETQHREIKPLYSSDRKGSAKSGVLMFHREKHCIEYVWKCWEGRRVKYSCWESEQERVYVWNVEESRRMVCTEDLWHLQTLALFQIIVSCLRRQHFKEDLLCKNHF